jgi:hypothetical protein
LSFWIGRLPLANINLLIYLGPVIRINPDEVHIDDPDFFDQVFNQTNGRAEKPLRVAEVFGPYPAVGVPLWFWKSQALLMELDYRHPVAFLTPSSKKCAQPVLFKKVRRRSGPSNVAPY